MAKSIFDSTPFETYLEGEEAKRSERGVDVSSFMPAKKADEKPAEKAESLDDVAIRDNVPANVLAAISEMQGDTSPAAVAANAKRMRAEIDAGKKMEDIFDQSVLDRATAIGRERYGMTDDKPAEAKSESPSVLDNIKDAGKDLAAGGVMALQDANELARMVRPGVVNMALDAAERFFGGKTEGEALKDASKAIVGSQTPAMQEAQQKKWWDSDKGWFGPAWGDWRSYTSGVLQSAPESLLTMVPAAGLARGAYAAKIAAGAAPEVAAKAAAKAATLGGMIIEGAFGGAQSKREVTDQVRELPDDVLQNSEAFKSLVGQGMSAADAKEKLATDLGMRAFVTGGVATGLFGGMGDRVIAKIMTEKVGQSAMKRFSKAAAEATVGEALEEFPQSGLQQMAQNEALQKADSRVNLTDDALNQAFGGLATGAMQGAGTGVGASALNMNAGHVGGVRDADAPVGGAPALPPPATPPAGPLGRAMERGAPEVTITDAEGAQPADTSAPGDLSPTEAPPAEDNAPSASSVEDNAAPSSAQRVTISADGVEIGGVLEAQDEAGATVLADDGNRYTITAEEIANGVTITPQADAAPVEHAAGEVDPPLEAGGQTTDGEAEIADAPFEQPNMAGASTGEGPVSQEGVAPVATDHKLPPTEAASAPTPTEAGAQPAVASTEPLSQDEQKPTERKTTAGRVKIDRLPPMDANEAAAIGSMDEPALRERLDYLKTQAKGNGGWNKRLMERRQAVEAALAKRAERAERETHSDAAAHEAATSPRNDLAEPSQAQKEAGNYKMGHVTLGGLDISIENPQGSTRSGVDKGGKPWSVEMQHHYGYIKGTVGKDKDHVDVFVRPGVDALADDAPVFVVNQVDPQSGAFDEHKVMLGYANERQASDAYRSNYDKDWKGAGPIQEMTVAQFRDWVKDPENTKKQAAFVEPEAPIAGVEPASTPRPSEPAITDLQDDDGNFGVREGTVLRTVSGREMSPAPKFDVSTPRKRSLSIKRQREWLIDEALKEAENSLHPEMRRRTIEAMKVDNLSRSDRDDLNDMLFGDADGPSESHVVQPVSGATPAAPKITVRDPEKVAAMAAAAKKTQAEYVAAEAWWTDDLTDADREVVGRLSGVKSDAKSAKWRDLPPYSQHAIAAIKKTREYNAALEERILAASVVAKKTEETSAAIHPEWGAKNKLVSKDRAAELRAKLRDKLKNQLNAGIDPEVLAIGAELAAFHIEAGARKFADFARALARDLDTTVDKIRPYLRAWYNGARDMMEDAGHDIAGTDGPDAVKAELAKLKGDEGGVRELDQSGARALEGVPAEEVQGASDGGAAPVGSGGRGRADASGNERAGGSGLHEQRGVGDDARAVPVSARGKPEERTRGERGGESVQRPDAPAKPASEGRGRDGVATPAAGSAAQDRASDFAHADADRIGEGGAKTKFRNNVAAIKLLKQLEAEGRQATRAEQAILSKYVGWGGIPQAFERSDKTASKGWEREVAELRDALTPEELATAAASTRNAHYTSPEVVKAMWGAARRLGFHGGRVLEPSVGVGNFFGLMPPDLRNASTLHGVELDRITGGIAKQLYPAAKIASPMGFQDYAIPDGHFDLVIGNPPFGAERLYDPTRKDLSKFSIHNYFFAKAIDGLRPGGVLAMVVTNRMMDAARDEARQYIADRTQLLGAVRLPNDAFAKNAGTQVTTDIVFLRKRADGEPAGASWLDVRPFKDESGASVPLNSYFHTNPDMMLGEFGAFGSMYRPDDPALVAREDQDTDELLADAIERLPANAMTPATKPLETVEPGAPKAVADVRVGSMYVDGDAIMVRDEDRLGEKWAHPVEFASEKARARVAGMIGVRDAFANVRKLQLDPNAKVGQIENARKTLNVLYDRFVKTNGPINLDANKRLFRDDPSWPQIAALEDEFDKGLSAEVAKKTGEAARKPTAKKAAVFTRRTQRPYTPPTSAATAKDALVASLSDRGRVDLPFMEDLYGKPREAIISELGDLVYDDPVRGVVTADEYLSGNVKKKLAEAREAAKLDRSMRRNIEALEAVQPTDVEAIDIGVKPGAHWLPRGDMAAFASHISGSEHADVSYNPTSAKWFISAGATNEASAKWGTDRASVSEILNAAANQKTITIRDRIDRETSVVNEKDTQLANDKVRAVAEEFGRWIWADDDRRERLTRLYNDMFNTDVQRSYDGSHLKLPGKVSDDVVELRPHQANAIWRAMQSPTTLLDHVVGAGKTYTMVGAAMEMRRTGLARKPMFVVPNHLVSQWAADFVKLYPGAQVLATTKKDFEKENRKKLFARVATGDWDAVVVAHSSFGKVEVEPEAQAEFIEQQVADLQKSIDAVREAEGEKSRNVKQIQASIAARKEKMKRLLDDGRKDDNLYWGELGVDALFVDEAHEFKNLEFSTSMNRIAGLGNTAGSQKASDLYLKSRQVLKATGGRNVTFATGTPISNTMAEMFTMQRYLDGANIDAQGLSHFDAWARQFGEVVTDWELSPSGKYKLNSRFAKFVNIPELMQRYRSFADVVTRDDISKQLAAQGKTLPVPKIKGGKPENVVVGRSPAQASYIGVPIKDAEGHDTENYPKGSLIYRAEHLPKGAPKKGDDNMLKIMSDARKAALDMRLIYPDAGDYAGSKINIAAQRISDLYRKWDADKGTQLVFIDLSTPKGAQADESARIRDLMQRAEDGDEVAAKALDKLSPDDLDALNSAFSVYDDLKQKLIREGIRENEIAFIHDAKTDLQKAELFGKVRSGAVRVLFGSTSKMGAGTNVQDRLVALHHIDAPWRPSDLEQREGRIVRQGNKLYERDPNGFEVEVSRYATKQTLDSRMWQTIEGKARFIEQVRKGDGGAREIEDIGGEAANAAEMKAASSGNPLILEEMTLRQSLKRLENERKGFESDQYRLRDTIRWNERSIASDKASLESMRKDAAPGMTPDKFEMTIAGEAFESRKEAGKAIMGQANLLLSSVGKDSLPLGSYGGFKLTLDRADERFLVTLHGAGEYQTTDFGSASDGQGVAQRIVNAVSDLAGRIPALEERIAKNEAANPRMKADIREWPKAGELENVKARHDEVINTLKPKKRTAEEAKADVEAQKSKRSIGDKDDGFQSTGEFLDHLQTSPDGVAVKALMDAGKIVVVATQDALPSPLQHSGRVQGATDANGVIHLVAENLTQKTSVPVLLHEMFHAGGETLLGDKRWTNLLDRLEKTLDLQSERMESERSPFWRDALRRIDDANVPTELRAEELAAYAIEVRERTPHGIMATVDNLVGALKAFVLRKFGVQLGAVTPGQLRAIARAALHNGAPTDPNSRSRDAISEAMRSVHDFGPDFRGFTNDPEGAIAKLMKEKRGEISDAFIHPELGPIAFIYGDDVMGLSHIVHDHGAAALHGVPDLLRSGRVVMDEKFPRAYIVDDAEVPNLAVIRLDFDGKAKTWLITSFPAERGTFARRKEDARNQREAYRTGLTGERAPSPNEQNEDNPDLRNPQDGKPPRRSIADDETVEEKQAREDGWLKHKLTDTMTQAMPALLATVPLRPMLDELTRGVPAAKSYLATKQAMDTLRNVWHERVAATADKWLKYRAMNRDENRRLMDMMHETTLAQVDPSKPFQSIMTQKDEDTLRGGRKGAAYEAADAKRNRDRIRRAAYRDLKTRFDAMSDDAKRLYEEVRDSYGDMADEFEATILGNMEKALKIAVKRAERDHAAEMRRIADDGLIGKERDDAVEAADKKLKGVRTKTTWNARWRLNKLRAEFETHRMVGPYFPLARFGKFFVTARDDDGKVVSFSRFEKVSQQRKFAEEMRAHGNKVETGVLADPHAMRGQIDPNFVADVEDILSGADAPDAIKDQIWQRYLEQLPDFSIRKNRIHRIGRAGFHADAMRAFASNQFHGAHQLARLRYGQDLSEHIADAREQVKATDDPVRSGLVINELEKRHAFVMNPTGSAAAQAITSAMFVYHLSASPAAALVNISQTVIIGVPMLGAYHGGVASAGREIMRATKDFTMGKGSVEGATSLSDDERKAVQAGYDLGVIDKSQAHDLAGIGEVGVEYNAAWQKVMKAISWAFHQGERFNREVTYLAAYRLARQKGDDHGAAIAAASRLTWKAHFDYQNTSRPRAMQHDALKVALVFRNYQANMLFRLFRDTYQSLKGADEAERKEARKQLLGVTAMLVANAGVKGVWMFGIATMLAGMFFRATGDDRDPDEELQKAAVSMLGPTLANIALNGLPGYATGTDLSGRIGMPDLWFRSPDRQMEGKEEFYYWVSQLFGASLGTAESLFRGFSMVQEGNAYRGIETMAPKAIKDVMRAYRYQTEGLKTLDGNTIMPRDKLSYADIFKQAIGFTPAQVAERYQINQWNRNRNKAVEDARKEAITAYADAAKAKDDAAKKKALAGVAAYNSKHPENPISGRNIIQSMKATARNNANMVDGVRVKGRLKHFVEENAAPSLFGDN